jgi:hypothetical protein
MKGLLIMMVLFVVTDTILEYTYQLNLMVNHNKIIQMVIKTFFYLQTMLMGFVDKHIFGVHFWYIIFGCKL